MSNEDVKARLHAALVAGPTPGKWEAYTGGAGAIWSEGSAVVVGPAARRDKTQNAKDLMFIAAACPERVAVLLDENARLLSALESREKDAGLLAALVAVRKQTRHPDYDWPLDLQREVDEVIAKATQEQQHG